MPRISAQSGARGFTLVELLVVMGIFSVVIVVVSDIFLLSNRSQRKLFGLERTQADARYTLEAVVREVRTGALDYAYYQAAGTGLTGPVSVLALRDSTDTPIVFRLSGPTENAKCADPAVSPCLLVSVDGAAEQPITPKNVAVRSLAFYVGPTADPLLFDPLTGTYASNVQPFVTVSLVLESRGEKTSERSVVSVQTTAVSRTYAR